MGKRKTSAMPTNPPKEKKKMVINMNKAELAKSYKTPGFRTGKYLTEKDRPRKKDWKREYAKGRKESDRDDTTDSFFYGADAWPSALVYNISKIRNNKFGLDLE